MMVFSSEFGGTFHDDKLVVWTRQFFAEGGQLGGVVSLVHVLAEHPDLSLQSEIIYPARRLPRTQHASIKSPTNQPNPTTHQATDQQTVLR